MKEEKRENSGKEREKSGRKERKKGSEMATGSGGMRDHEIESERD